MLPIYRSYVIYYNPEGMSIIIIQKFCYKS